MTTRTGSSNSRVRLFLGRYGPKAAILALGAMFAVGSLQNTSFLPKPNFVEKPFSDVLVGKTATEVAAAAVRPWSVLDAGLENDRISAWVDRLTGNKGVARTLAAKDKYDDMIARKLEERHMPADLVYLAMIESNFNPRAKSPVKAVGLWQFMAATAREFGLVVRGKTDERTDPEKATDAALTYLQQLKDRFGSWYLAAAAYNSGGGTVSKALRQVTGKTTGTDSDFFRILSHLPKETQDYVPKLIATARVGNDPARYGLTTKQEGGEVFLAPETQLAAASSKKVDSVTLSPMPISLQIHKGVATKAPVKKPTVKKPAVKKPAVRRPR